MGVLKYPIVPPGTVINDLTVLEDTGKSKMLCECVCGTVKEVVRARVFSGKLKSCGCRKNKVLAEGYVRFGDLVGKTVGELEVLSKSPKRQGYYVCKCSCGEVREFRATSLNHGGIQTCGHPIYSTEDLTGQTINEWEVIERRKNGFYLCRCSCGVEREVSGSVLRDKSSKSCGHHIQDRIDARIGTKLGDWTIKEYLGGIEGNYLFECKCGETIKSPLGKFNKRKSFICPHTKYIGGSFGKLTPYEVSYMSDFGPQRYKCRCECGNETEVWIQNLKNGTARNCGCDKKTSQQEDDLYALFPEAVRNQMPIKSGLTSDGRAKSYEVDLYFPDKQLGIEFNGDYWHSTRHKDKEYHWTKTKMAEQQGIRLIHIYEHEWVQNREKLVKYIDKVVNNNVKRIYARKCIVREVSAQESKDFENTNHLQGYVPASIRLGLYFEGELVGMMTFGKSRFDKNYEYEMFRLTYGDYNVVGGTERLFKHFIKQYQPKSVVTYCDRSKFTGEVYSRIGFQHKGHTGLGYVWVKHSSVDGKDTVDVRKRYDTQKHKLIKAGLGTEEQTEVEIMSSHRYFQIYDCGNDKYVWVKS